MKTSKTNKRGGKSPSLNKENDQFSSVKNGVVQKLNNIKQVDKNGLKEIMTTAKKILSELDCKNQEESLNDQRSEGIRPSKNNDERIPTTGGNVEEGTSQYSTGKAKPLLRQWTVFEPRPKRRKAETNFCQTETNFGSNNPK